MPVATSPRVYKAFLSWGECRNLASTLLRQSAGDYSRAIDTWLNENASVPIKPHLRAYRRIGEVLKELESMQAADVKMKLAACEWKEKERNNERVATAVRLLQKAGRTDEASLIQYDGETLQTMLEMLLAYADAQANKAFDLKPLGGEWKAYAHDADRIAQVIPHILN